MTAPTDDPYSLADCIAKRDAAIAARALREFAAREHEMSTAWGGDLRWLTTGANVAALVAAWANEEADEIERAAGGGA